MSKFQLILLLVFGAFILVAVLLFSFSRSSSNVAAKVVIWGDIPGYDFNELVNQAGLSSDKNISYIYVEKKIDTFDTVFTEALAEGKGPDLIIAPLENIWKNKNRLGLISYKSISESDFKNAFIEEGELFLVPDGIYAIPIQNDPMVLYWNRDLFSKASLSKPPVYWDEMYDFATKLTEKDAAGNLVKSAITLGESKNIPHAKEILTMLMLQAGTPITDYIGRDLRAVINQNFNLPLVPGEAALDFYTQFANPLKPFYSWNRSLKTANTSFIGGDVAMYLGFASELKELKAKNPNLNIGIAPVPQSRVSGKAITYGNLRGISVVRNSKNLNASLSAAIKLASSDLAKKLSNISSLPPARRDLLSTRPDDTALSVFYTASIQSRGWRDPDYKKTRTIFNEMIDSVTSGRARVQEAISRANREIDNTIK
jgi:ABC-type glycerol-3-phosphate transport system substrate-binding protein